MKNRGNSIFFAVIALFLVLVFVYQYFTPVKFVWTPSFDKQDKQPFGSYVFDDVVSSSVAGGYQVVDKTFYQCYMYNFHGEKDEEDESLPDDSIVPLPPHLRQAYLVTARAIDFPNADLTALMHLLKQGNKVMLCLERFPHNLSDSLRFSMQYAENAFFDTLEQYVSGGHQRDSLFIGSDTLHPEGIFYTYPHMHQRILKNDAYTWADTLQNNLRQVFDSLELLAFDARGDTLAMRFFIGEGELFLVSTPLMFTNYGVLDGTNAAYTFRLLSYLNDMPLTRLDAYGARRQTKGSPLRYVLSQPPLRWALYTSLVVIILCMIFTAKRRQCVIPPVQPPANVTLRFTCLIGNMYYQRKDCKDILRKKYLYFAAWLKQQTGIDLHSGETDGYLASRIAERIGQYNAHPDRVQLQKPPRPTTVWPAFRELKYLLRDETSVTENDMIRQIDHMNEWMRFLI